MKTRFQLAALLPLLGTFAWTAAGCQCGASRAAGPNVSHTGAVDSSVQRTGGAVQNLTNEVKTGAQQTAADVKQGAQTTANTAEQDLQKVRQGTLQELENFKQTNAPAAGNP